MPTSSGPALQPALRSMKDPGNANPHDDQPADMDGYVDGGDVHTNSGIPNQAFYVLATTLGGNAWDAAGPIWYADAARRPAHRRRRRFQEFARLSVRNAMMIYGAQSAEADAVRDVLGGGEGATLSGVRIRVRRVGGIAGNIALAAELQTADLPSADAARLEEALGGAAVGSAGRGARRIPTPSATRSTCPTSPSGARRCWGRRRWSGGMDAAPRCTSSATA